MARYEMDSNQFGLILSLRGPWHTAIQDVLREHKIAQLQLWYSDGWRGVNLEFLERLPFLEGLYIWDQSGLDVSGVGALSNLKRLHMRIWNKPSKPVPFHRLVNLESCEMEWNPALGAVLECCSLRRLVVSDVRDVSIFDLRQLKQLEDFWLTRAPHVREIQLPRKSRLVEIVLRKLPSLKLVKTWAYAESLARVWLAECKQLDVANVAQAPAVRKLDLFNMGRIRSLRFVGNMPHLERLRLSGSTEIQDGALAFLTRLLSVKRVAFPRKARYDITAAEANRLIRLQRTT
jgi:hypothetical protein